MQINALSNYIKKQTPTYMTIYGGMAKQKEVVDCFAQEVSSFLLKNKGKCLTLKDIANFYKDIFPKIKLNIKKRSQGIKKQYEKFCKDAKKTPSFFEKIKIMRKLNDTCGSCEVLIHHKKNFIKGFSIELPDFQQSWFSKNILKSKTNKNGKFFVDKDFADVFLHEGVHLLQGYIKPVAVAHSRMLLKHSKNRFLARELEEICNKIYAENIYVKGFGGKTRRKLIEDIVTGLKKPVKTIDGALYYPTDKVVMTQIKAMIRSFEAEKQAYEKGERLVYKFKYPRLEKYNFIKKYTDKKTAEMVDNYYYFNEKIKILKEIYLDMAKKERAKMGLVK